MRTYTHRSNDTEYSVFVNSVEDAVEKLVQALRSAGAGERADAAKHIREQADSLHINHRDRDLLLAIAGGIARRDDERRLHPWRGPRLPRKERA